MLWHLQELSIILRMAISESNHVPESTEVRLELRVIIDQGPASTGVRLLLRTILIYVLGQASNISDSALASVGARLS